MLPILLRQTGNQIWEHLRSVSHPAIFPDMRIGKTLPVFRYVSANYQRILLVAPIGACSSWVKWMTDTIYVPFYIMPRGARERAFVAVQDASWTGWFIVNPQAVEGFSDIKYIDFDCVILDESRFIANAKNFVSKYFVKNFRNVKKRIIITGTPAPEHDLEYVQQLNFLDPDLLRMNYWQFRSRFARRYGGKWWIMPAGKKKIDAALKQCAFFMNRASVRDDEQTEKIYRTEYVDLPDYWRKIYDKIEEELILAIPGKNQVKTIFSIVKFHWLRRLCAGVLSKEEYPTLKISRLINVIHALPQAVIWANYLDEVSLLHDKVQTFFYDKEVEFINAKKSKTDRESIVKAFQHGEINYLIAHPVCCRFGNDFSSSRTAVYYTAPLGLETRLQSEDRIINMSINSPANIVDIVWRDTIEEDILKSLRKKESRQKMQKRIYEAIQSRQA